MNEKKYANYCLYGIAGAADNRRIIRYKLLTIEGDLMFDEVISEACKMRFKDPSIENIYCINNRKGLAFEVSHIMKRNRMADNIAFKDMCERSGWKIF